ncbi:MAG: quinolinate synthase [Planctomycetes bacterium GWF2_41_51]|nr:MAG: quinolinate synthase [Planctomycetes bacterium GWF2_41_51]HBG26564.1 quinolinate synthase [Phycisphaerales bacterium]
MNESIIEKINTIKKKKNAIILAHNYQTGEIQDIADFTGDSLELSRKAADNSADVIVFCGVLFMAETASILSPNKTVLLPDKTAGCPMADMITAPQLAELKQKYPDAVVVCYVNSSAQVKAISDYCCTSSNAVDVVNSIEAGRKIIFVPDKNLGQYVKDRTGRDLVLWPGYCPTHHFATIDAVKEIKNQHPDAMILAHPECPKEIRDFADVLLSTGQMLKYVKNSASQEFIIATEIGIIHTLKKQNPGKIFYPASEKFICPNMKKITIEKVLFALEDNKFVIKVPDEIAEKARKALERMVGILPKG